MMNRAGSDAQDNTHAKSDTRHEELLVLHRKYLAGGDGHGQAYDKLVTCLSPMAWKRANQIAGWYGVDAADLFQDGFKDGMRPSIDSYNELSGSKIATYVRNAIENAMRKKVTKYRKWRSELAAGGGDILGEQGILYRAAECEDDNQHDEEGVRCLLEIIRKVQPRLTRGERSVLQQLRRLSAANGPVRHKEVAKACGKSRSRVTQIIRCLKRKLLKVNEIRKMVKELGCSVEVPIERGKSCRSKVDLATRSR